jgi:hypothetical protein
VAQVAALQEFSSSLLQALQFLTEGTSLKS